MTRTLGPIPLSAGTDPPDAQATYSLGLCEFSIRVRSRPVQEAQLRLGSPRRARTGTTTSIGYLASKGGVLGSQ